MACSEGNPAPWGTSQLPFPTFNGYSPSTPAEGVTGPVVYANYGRREDFELLAKMGVFETHLIAAPLISVMPTKLRPSLAATAVSCRSSSENQSYS